MNFVLSDEAQALRSGLAIYDLMDDLGNAMASLASGTSGTEHALSMLGGGNPAAIPDVEAVFRSQLSDLVSDDARIARLLGDYDTPHGSEQARTAVANYLNGHFDCKISTDNVAFVPGSQAACSYLFSMFGGKSDEHARRKILFPLGVEYIGYFGAMLGRPVARGVRPRVETTKEKRFRYRLDWERVKIEDNDGAVCVSMPSNPTGNLLAQADLDRLTAETEKMETPLILDLAYGTPFPGICYQNRTYPFNANTIYCFSLSKIGLPGLRTGIVIAAAEVIDMIARYNAAFVLANNNIGSEIVSRMMLSGELDRICERYIQPFYHRCRSYIIDQVTSRMENLDYAMHEPDGAFFLWLNFPSLKISSQELYQRLKARGVLVIPGEAFFSAIEGEWEQRQRCVRISYAQPPETIDRGLSVLVEEVSRASA